MSDSTLTLEQADAQDLADVVCGLTVIGAYADNAGLEDVDRIKLLRRRVIRENEDLARAMLASEFVTNGVDPQEFRDGVRDVLEGDE